MIAKLRKQGALILRKWPALYHLVANIYSTLSFIHLAELLFGTKVRERVWARRHLHKGNDWGNEEGDWIKGYWDSRNHSHRDFLIERICRFSPSSILEIGSNCGPNLYLLAKKSPDAQISGIDINPMAVQKGNEWLAQEGISNVKLSVGKADDLGEFQDKSFDIVFTDAVLIYIGPDKIKEVIKSMIRVARRALILMERHCFETQRRDPNGLGVYHHGSWKRDYVALLKQFVPAEQIRVTKIPENIWPDKNWKTLGAIVELVL
jgi:ubiquinone/menaquinone biosynthesis C-methylase UbiE